MSKVKKSVSSAIADLEENDQASTTSIPMMEQMTSVNQIATTTGANQRKAKAVDRLAPGTVMDPAVATMNRIATFDTITSETTTIPPLSPGTAPTDTPATTAQADAPATTAPADSHAIALVGSGTNKKTGIMRPNPHSTTAR